MEHSNLKVSSWVVVYGLAFMRQTQLDLKRNIFSEQKLLWSTNPNISVHKKVFAECLPAAGINSKRWSVDNSTFQRWKINQSGAFSSSTVLNHRSHYSLSCYYHLQHILRQQKSLVAQHLFSLHPLALTFISPPAPPPPCLVGTPQTGRRAAATGRKSLIS